ncbi:hypothetical protein JYU29_04985 [Tianweitania sp. BSSL-BM11]|uniref:Uncharacterized protein n=1 Tax=Tianweitania aestuarii TaxID=2814886 RepID=A0ABS5RWH8_9HYPH|nr:hypothetical protein [Tianweitania aestuarii]MBS9720042.1 hypothetical protein [Tianweitania aestuarii]
MKHLLERYLPLRNAENEGGGGGGGTPPPAGAPGGEGGRPAADGSPPASDPPAGPYRPQGLPDTMFGENDRDTMDKMATALNGYRTRDSERGVPETADAYQTFDLDKVDEAVRPQLEALSSDLLFKAVADVALEEKVPVGAMQKIVTTLYSEAAKAGIFEPFLDVTAERQALIPTEAQNLPKAEQDRAIDARMQANEDFVKLLMKPGEDGKSQIDQATGEHVMLMLMDSANGNKFLEFFRSQMTGAEKPQPLGGGLGSGGGGESREALRAEMAKPEMQPNHPKFDRAAYDALDEKYKKLIGN